MAPQTKKGKTKGDTAQNAQVKETRSTIKVHAVVFSTGEVSEHADSIACGHFMKALPGTMRDSAKIVVFENRAECDQWKIENAPSTTSTVPKPLPATASKEQTTSPSAEAKRKSEALDLTDDLPQFSMGGESTNSVMAVVKIENAVATSPMAKKMRQQIQYKGMVMKVHHFTKIPGNPVIQPVMIDMCDPKGWTHWCHRASKWIEVFKFGKNELGSLPNRFIETVRCVLARHSDSDRPDTMSVTTATRTLTLHRDCFKGFLKNPMPHTDIIEYLKSYLKPMYTQSDFQECYLVQCTTRYSKPNLLNAVDPNQKETGKESYWKMLEGAITQSQELVPHECLNEVFLTVDIHQILRTMYPDAGLTDQMLAGGNIADELKLFAFGT